MELEVKILRRERHDFLNHLQILRGFLQLGKYEKVIEYIDRVSESIHHLQEYFRLFDEQTALKLTDIYYLLESVEVKFSIVGLPGEKYIRDIGQKIEQIVFENWEYLRQPGVKKEVKVSLGEFSKIELIIDDFKIQEEL